MLYHTQYVYKGTLLHAFVHFILNTEFLYATSLDAHVSGLLNASKSRQYRVMRKNNSFGESSKEASVQKKVNSEFCTRLRPVS